MFLKLSLFLPLILIPTSNAWEYQFDPDKFPGTDYTPPENKDINIGNWLELGRGIGGEGYDDLAGHSVAASAEGTIVAIGSPLHNTATGINAGRVRVYEYDEADNAWKMIGLDLVGEDGDEAGRAVAVSIAGDFVFVGAPKCTREVNTILKREIGCVKVYERVYVSGGGSEYHQVGNELIGEKEFDHFGSSVDGHAIFTNSESENYEVLQVAVGSPNAHNNMDERRGRVDFAEYVFNQGDRSGTWSSTLVGFGELYSKFGTSLSLSIDDSLLAVGAPNEVVTNEDNSKIPDAGNVYLFKRDNNSWTKLDFTEGKLSGANEDEECGASVSITLRGNYLAYGCPKAAAIVGGARQYQTGYAAVKKITQDLNTDTWKVEAVGVHLWGENSGDEAGFAVDIGDDGSSKVGTENLYLAVGAPFNDAIEEKKHKAGHVRVYHLQNNKWDRTELDIDGFSPYDQFGTSVAISFDGHRVISGAPGAIGYAKIYDLKYTQAPSVAPTMNPTARPTRNHNKPSKPSKPTNIGGNNKDDEFETSRGPSFFTILLFVALVPAVLFVLFKSAVYWKARRTYTSEFGADVQTSSPNNDLELSRSVNPNFNQDTAGSQGRQDVI